MSIKIEINCEPHEVDDHMSALGFSRATNTGGTAAPIFDDTSAEHAAFKARAFGDLGRYMTDEENAAYNAAVEAREDELERLAVDDIIADRANSIVGSYVDGAAVLSRETAPTPRKPGEPSPGKKRRSSAEVAEDEAYFAAVAAGTAPAATPAISTGEERINPDDPRDVEDESDSGKLTHDDLRAAHKRYVDKFGMPAALRDFRLVIGAPIADIPGTQEALAEAIAKVDAAIGGGVVRVTDVASFAAETEAAADAADAADSELFGDPNAAPKPKPREATKQDVVLAITAYAMKYDGESTDPIKMVNARADVPKIFAAEFGPDVVNLSQIPADPLGFGRACEAIDVAMKANPYGRKAHQ